MSCYHICVCRLLLLTLFVCYRRLEVEREALGLADVGGVHLPAGGLVDHEAVREVLAGTLLNKLCFKQRKTLL